MQEISIIIPTKNAGPEFEDTLEAIRAQDVSDIELIIIDSGSTDGTVKLAKKYADTVIEIPPDKFHHSKTRNIAANQAKGNILVFTVQDALPIDSKWLTELIYPIENGSVDVSYGNQVAYPDAKPPDKFFYQYFYPTDPITLTKSDTDSKSDFYLDNVFLSDVNSAISRSVWDQLEFRDSVVMSEDKDFAYRVASAGYTIKYCPRAKVYHSHNYNIRSLFKRRYKDGKAFSEIAGTGSDDFALDGIEYVWHEYIYLLRTGSVYWIPYAIIYDLTNFLAFMIGKHNIF